MTRKKQREIQEVETVVSTSCPICDRELGNINVDKHHLVPKTRGGKDKFLIHKICHRKIHATFTEKELEKNPSIPCLPRLAVTTNCASTSFK